jgi:hypothetical protein
VLVPAGEQEYKTGRPSLWPRNQAVGQVSTLGMEKTYRFYRASPSEVYGLVQEVLQRETTAF